jgi:hypothetical protein
MNTDPSLMDWLEPPGDGLNELKWKLARRNTRKKAIAGIGVTALVVATATAAFFGGHNATPPHAVSDRQWQAAIAKQEEKVRVINGAALELSAPGADTRIYLVSSMPEGSPPG